MTAKVMKLGNAPSKVEICFGAQVSKVREPIFIVGCGRSGTTLLFDILSSHPGIARTLGYPDGEDHEGWISHGKCVMAGIGNVHHSKYGNGINGQQFCLSMNKEDLNEDIVREMHNYYWTEVLGENKHKRVLNKQPHLSNKLDYVLGIFPDAKIIHIIRDCEPMIASWLAIMDDHPSLVVYWPQEEKLPCLWLMPKPDEPIALARLERHAQFYPGGGSELWIDYWCKVNSGIARQMQGQSSQLLTLRYEDLVTMPQAILAKITSFCDLSNFEFDIDHLRTNTAQKHTRRMTPELRASIADKSKPFRQMFGYESGASSSIAQNLYLP